MMMLFIPTQLFGCMISHFPFNR